MKETRPVSISLEEAIGQLHRLPPEPRSLVVSLIGRLAQAEGVSAAAEYRLPADNMGPWLTKLRSERKSEKTIRLYSYLAGRFLKQTPAPTRADMREYLARRVEETSPSSAETERKAMDQWKLAMKQHMHTRRTLASHTSHRLQIRTGYRFVEKPDETTPPGLLFPFAVELFFDVARKHALGVPDKTNLKENIVTTPDGYLTHRTGGSNLAYSPGSTQECRESMREALDDIFESDEFGGVTTGYAELEEATAKARKSVQDMVLLGFIPNNCRIYRRLGI